MSFAVKSAMSIFWIEQMDSVFKQVQFGSYMPKRRPRRQLRNSRWPKKTLFKAENKPISVIGMHIAANALCQKFWIG
jgi:hypothetical protein